MIDYTISFYDLEYFLLVFVRIASFIFISPFFSMQGVPNRVRVGLSVFVSALLYRAVTPAQALVYNTVLEYSVLVLKEAIAGLLIGFSANICTTIVNFAGTVADMEVGLSMMTLLDPATRESASITGVLYQYFFMFMLILTGMYRFLLGAIADSFSLIPVGGAVMRSERLLETMIGFLSDYVLIGFQIILPIFCTILLLNAVLGVLAKVAPQMNMFAVGIQLKVLVGLGVLFLTITLMPVACEFIFDEIRKMTQLFTESMIPEAMLP